MKILPENFRRNYKTIIVVTILAFLLWFMVKMNRNYEYVLDIPVRYVNLDPDRIFKFPQVRVVRVEFTGKGKDLLRLPFYNVDYRIDLSGAPENFEIDPSEHPEFINYPTDLDVSVKSVVRPRVIKIELDKRIEKKLPIEVQVDVETPPGYIFVGFEPEPDSITVIGPAVMFSKVAKLLTERKVYKEVSRAFRDDFSIQKVENYFAEYRPSRVKVWFDIQRLAEKLIPQVPVSVTNVPASYQVIPLPSETIVYVKGGEKILADLTAKDFKVEIDFLREWWPGVKRVKAYIHTTANVLYMETRPSEFELIVQKGRSEQVK